MSRRLSVRKRRAARAIGRRGASNREAARAAGLKSKRAREGVTIAEWRRDPAFQDLVNKYAEEAMSGAEWEARNALQARQQLPTRIVTDGQGRVLQVVYDADKPMERQGNALGKLKDRRILTGPDDGPIAVEVSQLSDAELQRRVQEKLKLAGGAPAGE